MDNSLTDKLPETQIDEIDAPWLSGGSSASTDGFTYGDFLDYDNACAALWIPKPDDLIGYIQQNLNRTQVTGLNCLIFLSLREQTTVGYQLQEWGFKDIPEYIAGWCDVLEENELIQLAEDIAAGLLDEITTAAVEPTNAQIIASD